MNKQRKVLITTTYNEMGIIIDTKVEEVAQPNLQPTCNQLATDTISRQAAIDYFVTNVGFHDEDGYPIEDECELREIWTGYFDGIPSAQPKRGKWIKYEQEFMLEGSLGTVQKTVRECSVCTAKIAGMVGIMNFCPNCGAKMEGVNNESD